jgi:hypothetical protein
MWRYGCVIICDCFVSRARPVHGANRIDRQTSSKSFAVDLRQGLNSNCNTIVTFPRECLYRTELERSRVSLYRVWFVFCVKFFLRISHTMSVNTAASVINFGAGPAKLPEEVKVYVTVVQATEIYFLTHKRWTNVTLSVLTLRWRWLLQFGVTETVA